MKEKLVKSLGPLIGGIVFLLALWGLRAALKEYHYHDIINAVRAIPSRDLLAALGLAVLGYLALTCYDLLAFRYIRQRLSYPKIAVTSFIGYAFSNTIGLSFLSGGSVRYRLYSGWALSPVHIAQIVAFCTVTGWVGFFGLGGIALLVEPAAVFAPLHLPFLSARLIGLLFVLGAAAYIVACAIRKDPVRFRAREFRLPPLRLAVLQLLVASVDFALAGAVLYALLPSGAGVSYPAFLGVFLPAIVAGLLSQVPGGIGVFETILVLLLSPTPIPTSSLLGSLIAFRGIYYLLPLTTAIMLMAGHETYQRRVHVARMAQVVGVWFPAVVPRLFASMTFVGGAILLFSGATPSVHGRITWLHDLLPLPVVETSHFLGSLAGAGLVLLARGIERKLDAAYFLASALLGSGIVFSLLKGFDYEEAIILGVMLALLLPCHHYFTRKTSLFSEPFTLGWIASTVLVLVSAAWLGEFSFKHVEYSRDLWWHFSIVGDAPRFLRASVGVAVLTLFFAAERLLHAARPKPVFPGPAELEKARSVIARSRAAMANLALLGDKQILFAESGPAFIMYDVEGRSWVAMGDPVGAEEEMSGLVWRFCEMAEHHAGWPVFYQVQPERLPLYLDLGMTLLKLGEEARVPLPGFSLEGNAHKSQRNLIHRLEKEGWTFEIVPAETVPSLLNDLEAVSTAWLREKNTREKRFSLGFFNPEYLRNFPHAVVRKADTLVAFANIWPGTEKEECSIDLMRYTSDAPHSVMEYLFLKLMLSAKDERYQWFNLGMAPLSGLETHALAPLWNRVGNLAFRHGEHFYNFQGLRQYKEKFDPVWKPKYLAFPGGLALPVILTNIATLISGGLKGVITK